MRVDLFHFLQPPVQEHRGILRAHLHDRHKFWQLFGLRLDVQLRMPWQRGTDRAVCNPGSCVSALRPMFWALE